MTLRLTEEDLEAIFRHGRDAYPEECCGLMIGPEIDAGSPVVSISEVVSAENEREDSSRHNRFLISPLALLEAQRSARRRGLDILGYYHSHPDHPARPSEFDREHAWPGTSYLIISVDKGSVVDATSWRLREDRSRFDEEELIGTDGEKITL